MRRMRFLCNKNGWFFPLKSGYLLIWIKVSVLLGLEISPILFYRYDPWLEDSNLISYLFHSDPKHERVLATRIIYAENKKISSLLEFEALKAGFSLHFLAVQRWSHVKWYVENSAYSCVSLSTWHLRLVVDTMAVEVPGQKLDTILWSKPKVDR